MVEAVSPVVAVPSRFAVLRELGAGGMGKVYEVHDRELAVNVALKLLHEGDGDAIEKRRAVPDAQHALRARRW